MKIKVDRYRGDLDLKIQAIKDFRYATGLGLKESKAVIDELCVSNIPTVDLASTAVSMLRDQRLFDFTYVGSSDLKIDIENLITRLIQQERYRTAKEMIDLLQRFTNRDKEMDKSSIPI